MIDNIVSVVALVVVLALSPIILLCYLWDGGIRQYGIDFYEFLRDFKLGEVDYE